MFNAVFSPALRAGVLIASLAAVMPTTVVADATDDIINANTNRSQAGAASQQRIDGLAEETDKIITQYHQQSKIVESLKLYNDRLRRTVEAQERAKSELSRSIEEASLIERQIVPLMLRMISGLEIFVGADMPFKLQERTERLERIKGYLNNANITPAERFRQVLDAYTIENDYGTSLAVYTDTLDLNGSDLTVNILQVGRAGLYYQTFDGQVSGYWNKENKSWDQLDSSHNPGITKAIRIVEGKETTDLMELPIIAPEVL
ncbi:MAG: DUF3450 domain-containing protein [Acidiferrobacterales bacterium]|nr:DUF3450 domain-containing protein [Acidiferrobacterales bacterium]